MAQRDAAFAQAGGLAHARLFEQLRRVHRARGQHHLAARPHRGGGGPAAQLHADAALAVEQQLFGQHAGFHAQVRTTAHRTQERLGRIPAPAAPLVHLEIAAAEVVAAIEILRARNPLLLRRGGKGFQDVPTQALRLHPPFASRAVVRVGAAVMVLAALEDRQHLVPAPRRIARQSSPILVVLALAAHVDHAVDRRAASQHAAARVNERTAAQPRLRRGPVHPVRAGVADAMQVPHRDMDPVVVVGAARLQQQHLHGRILA
ncbi:hypothetical protein D9M68_595090 [compost metagenome]